MCDRLYVPVMLVRVLFRVSNANCSQRSAANKRKKQSIHIEHMDKQITPFQCVYCVAIGSAFGAAKWGA